MKTMPLLIASELLGVCMPACAGVVLDRARVIFDADTAEVVVHLQNEDERPYLLQSWVDDGDQHSVQAPETSKAPFVLLPPITRIDSGRSLPLRLKALRPDLTKDRESLFWLNVLSIPGEATATAPADGVLSIAVATRVKLFWRPAGLDGSADQAAGALQWRAVREPRGACALRLENPSPYHVTVTEASVAGVAVFKEVVMVAPHARLQQAMDCMPAAAPVRYVSVGDAGQAQQRRAVLSESTTPPHDPRAQGAIR